MNWVPFHSDDEDIRGPEPTINSISFGQTRIFTIKNKTTSEALDLKLKSGSLLIMGKKTQSFWLHGILRDKNVTGGRINLTFREV